jgi:hypothetical protein
LKITKQCYLEITKKIEIIERQKQRQREKRQRGREGGLKERKRY